MTHLTKEEADALDSGVLDLMISYTLQPDKTKALRQLCQKQIDLEAQVAELMEALDRFVNCKGTLANCMTNGRQVLAKYREQSEAKDGE